TYRELDEASGRLASVLMAEYGVRAGGMVALLLPRSAHTVISVLAVLKTGAGYVPVDVAHPDDRVRFVLADSGAAALLTSGEQVARARALTDADRGGTGVAVVDVMDPAIEAAAVADIAHPR
ncbi:AMP-binding protein, partial [Nocardia sp. 2]